MQGVESFAQDKHWDISNLEELTVQVSVIYSFHQIDNIQRTYRSSLLTVVNATYSKKNTGVGPHRDDIAFLSNQMDANSDQVHRVHVYLKLAEIKLMKALRKETPILFVTM